jgi:hypothetical protein
MVGEEAAYCLAAPGRHGRQKSCRKRADTQLLESKAVWLKRQDSQAYCDGATVTRGPLPGSLTARRCVAGGAAVASAA